MKALRIFRKIVLGLVVLVLLLLVALQVVLRPKVLTPIVNDFAKQYVEGGELMSLIYIQMGFQIFLLLILIRQH